MDTEDFPKEYFKKLNARNINTDGIEVVEDGDPWENSRTVELTLTVDAPVVEDSTEEN